jgi:predicted membrane metal-binding protein
MQKLSFKKLPPFLQMFSILLLRVTALFFALHLIFYYIFDPKELPLNSSDLMTALWLGIRFDLRVAIALLLPLFLAAFSYCLDPYR